MTKLRSPTAAEVAADVLRSRILAGALAPGDLLPGERDLSEQLGISRLTLRSGLARLEAEGLLQSSQGLPTRVLDYRQNAGVDILEYLAKTEGEGGTIPLELLVDLLELRRLVAVEMVCLVAARATEAERSEMRDALDALRDAVSDADAFVQADLAFARVLVRAAHNLAIELLYNTITRVIGTSEALRPVFLINATTTVATYEALLALLESDDAGFIRETTRGALEALDADTLARLGGELETQDETTQGGC